MPSLGARRKSSEGKGTRLTLRRRAHGTQEAGLANRPPGNEEAVALPWLLLVIPGTIALLTAILFLSALAEQRFLSPRSMILGAVRARRNTPEHAEAVVAREFERLLGGEQSP